jgi:hypothetical protein
VAKDCELCPGSEDVWLESARLQTPDNAKAILARGVAAIPSSVKLWMQARRAAPPPRGPRLQQGGARGCVCARLSAEARFRSLLDRATEASEPACA